jgi:hypothetical protein
MLWNDGSGYVVALALIDMVGGSGVAGAGLRWIGVGDARIIVRLEGRSVSRIGDGYLPRTVKRVINDECRADPLCGTRFSQSCAVLLPIAGG